MESRAANGVIVVTTKKGAIGPARFSYNHSSKYTRRPRYSDRNINLMNSQERVQFGKELCDLHYKFPSDMTMVGYEGALNSFYKGLSTYDEFVENVKRSETVNTDWFDILTRDTYSHDPHVLVFRDVMIISVIMSSLGYNKENGGFQDNLHGTLHDPCEFGYDIFKADQGEFLDQWERAEEKSFDARD